MTDRLDAQRIEGFGLSEDGKFAQFKFSTDDDGGAIRITMPVGYVAEFYRELGKLVGTLKAAGKIEQPPIEGRAVRHWKVGQSNDPRLAKQTALLFDEGTPQEAMYVFADLDALKIADAIEEKVFKGLKPDEQRALMLEVEKGKRKIILPGGHA